MTLNPYTPEENVQEGNHFMHHLTTMLQLLEIGKIIMLSPCVHIARVVKAISTGGHTGSHTLRVITEGVDKPVFQMIWVAV